jgi:hypothetical protein
MPAASAAPPSTLKRKREEDLQAGATRPTGLFHPFGSFNKVQTFPAASRSIYPNTAPCQSTTSHPANSFAERSISANIAPVLLAQPTISPPFPPQQYPALPCPLAPSPPPLYTLVDQPPPQPPAWPSAHDRIRSGPALWLSSALPRVMPTLLSTPATGEVLHSGLERRRDAVVDSFFCPSFSAGKGKARSRSRSPHPSFPPTPRSPTPALPAAEVDRWAFLLSPSYEIQDVRGAHPFVGCEPGSAESVWPGGLEVMGWEYVKEEVGGALGRTLREERVRLRRRDEEEERERERWGFERELKKREREERRRRRGLL